MYFVLSLCLLVGCAEATSPRLTTSNIKASITSKGLEYANKVFMGSLAKEIGGLKTSDISKSALGSKITLLSPRVSNVAVKSSSFRFESGMVQAQVLISNAMATGKYRYSFGWFSTSKGTFTATMKNVALIVNLALGRTNDGKFKIINRGCNSKIEVSKYHFKGGSSWLLNPIVSLVKGSVQNEVKSKICVAVNKAIDKKAAKHIVEYAKDFNISQVPCASLAYKILEDPVVKNYYCSFAVEGKIKSSCYPQAKTTHKDDNKVVPPTPHKMATIALSDSFINSLLNLYHQAGLTNATMDAKTRGNVSSVTKAAIQLSESPVIRTTINGSTISIQGRAAISSTLPNKIEGAFKAEGQLILEGRNTSLAGKLRNVRLRSCDTTVKSFMNGINSAQINKAFHEILHDMISLPFVNGMVMKNPEIVHRQGQTIVETDVSYGV